METIAICAPTGRISFGPSTDTKWQQEYRRHRYMEHLPDSDLHHRQRDVFRNFMTINEHGKASPLPLNHPMHGYWRIRFNHIVQEFRLRFGPYPAGFEHGPSVYFPDPTSKRRLAGCAAVAKRTFEDGKFLFKYGERVHLEQTLKQGGIRICPASFYADDCLGRAIHDEELTMEHWVHEPTPERIRQLLGRSVPEPLLDGAAVLSRSSEDAWLYCLSATYDAAIYDDFPNYDSCLIIHEPEAFRDKLLWEAHRQLNARGHAFQAVTFVDPLTQVERSVPILFQKSARYAYQDEVRAAWLPGPGETPKPTFVRLGNLEAVAELICI